jgi:transcriptional regulator with XRE-family HTH domain
MQVTQSDGLKIRTLREARDLTVDELVAALKEREGLKRHPDTIRNIELGHSRAGFKLLNAIARVLDVPREEIMANAQSGTAE